jgi:hypothetical protein
LAEGSEVAVLLGGDRRWARERIDLAAVGGSWKPDEGRLMVLHDQMEEILGEIWRQEAWAETEDRIDVLVSQLRPAAS